MAFLAGFLLGSMITFVLFFLLIDYGAQTGKIYFKGISEQYGYRK